MTRGKPTDAQAMRWVSVMGLADMMLGSGLALLAGLGVFGEDLRVLMWPGLVFAGVGAFLFIFFRDGAAQAQDRGTRL